MVQRTYVLGPNIARGAECDADVLMLRQSLSSGLRQHNSRSRAFVASTDKPFGGPWVPSRQDNSSPLITVNAALAPQWPSALDIGRQVLSGNPFPGSPTGRVELVSHSPTPPAAAGSSGPPRYQPPVQLVVLSGALQRLGPSNPWRYTVGRLATLDLQGQQPPLSPGPTRMPQQQQGWAFDATTQTAPPELARDWEAMHRGSSLALAAPAAGDCVAAAVRPQSGMAAQRRCTAPRAATAGAAAAAPGRAGRQPGRVRALECNPWQLTFKQQQQQEQEPWVPSYRAAADWKIAAAVTADGQGAGGRRRSQSATPADRAAAAALAATKAAAAARRCAAVKFAALGRRAGVVRAEGLAAAAAAATVAAGGHDGSSDAGSCCCCGGNTVVCLVDASAAAAADAHGSHCNICSCSPGAEASRVADSLSTCSAASNSSSSSGGGGSSVYLPCCDEVRIQDLAALMAEV